MKIKLQLETSGTTPRDLLVTADAATTVGDVARHLRLADPRGSTAADSEQEWTLSLAKESRRLLDPRTPLGDSPIRSGALITVLPAGRQFASNERATVAVATILEGPGAGMEFRLGSGTNIIGRNRTCEIRLEDPLASRQHARLNITDHIQIIDLGSANGVELNGSVIAREVVRPSDVIQIGDTRLSVRMVQVESAAGRTEGSVGFIRSPRLAPRYSGREFSPPEPPQRSQRQPFPVSMLVMPILMAGVLYLVTKQWQTLIFAGLSPLMMLGSWWEQRRHGRTADKNALAGYRQDLDSLCAELAAEQVVEVSGRLAEHPSAHECMTAVGERRPLMWTRRPDGWGFLDLRLGLGTMPSRSTIKPVEARSAPRDLAAEASERLAPFGSVEGVPVVASPVTTGALGVAGPRSAAIGAARALVVQAAALHSPAELAICLLASQRGSSDWSWLKWLPHVDAPWSPVEARHLAANPADSAALLSALFAVVEQRSSDDKLSRVPRVLVIIESDSPLEFGRLVDLAEAGTEAGVHVLWIAPELEQLPASCKTYVDVSALNESGVGYLHDALEVTPVTPEMVSPSEALDLAIDLAPVVDLGASNEDSSDLPRTISFLAMDGYESMGDQPEAVLERWTQNHSILTGPRANEPWKKAASLRAAVGHTAGHLHQLDLRTDGPHALVGGTTGAGKSELLQTWILSMAANHSPQRLTFLLVDYKGGSAFAECEHLPHTVGMVTNLDANGVQRALKSLTAELDHRMKVLQDAKAKDLMELEKRWDITAPPSLVIVVDEFAALVQEVPEFVDGVVNVAQRGRSLGLHLILATQRPAGVIKDNLRANTNLRMALRVADEADSSDVLGVPDAAFFDPDLPGRAVSKTGAGRLLPFQTAYVGGHTGSGPSRPDVRVEELAMGPGLVWEVPEGVLPAAGGPTGPTDIARVVSTIQDANGTAQLPAPRRPWLPDLATQYDVVRLLSDHRSGDRLVFGMADLPEQQAQQPVFFEPDRSGNLFVQGASGSGKSTALRTFAVAAGVNHQYGSCWVYGLDFGAQGLAMLHELPHVGAVVRGSDDERVRRLLRWLRDTVDERAVRYAKVNAGSVSQYRSVTGKKDEPRILLLLDGLGAFLKEYEANDVWIDTLTAIAAAGRPVGVHVLFASDRATGISSALAATIQQRLVLRMPSVDDYDYNLVPRGMLSAESPAGRGVWDKTEIQVALLGGTPDLGGQAREMSALGLSMSSAGVPEAPPIRSMPERVDISALPVGGRELVIIGVRDDTLGALGVEPVGTFAICGPPSTGRTTALHTMARSVRRAMPDAEITLLTQDRRSPLLVSPVWNRTVLGDDAARGFLEDLEPRLEHDLERPLLLVVERLSDWGDSMVETQLESVVKAAIRAGAFVVCDSDVNLLGRTMGLPAAMNASRVGFVLGPDGSEGSAFGGKLPTRLNRANFPPGRGFYLKSGRHVLAHLAWPS
ncbi:MAG TPA: FtsK/SpoIIIE domain-containing protein [Tetrasphaera sp.]|nr:FtsK/SpoIIIE domain-containing protein [Tetrasphaera sp.]